MIELCYICSERKICSTIRKSQNITNMIVAYNCTSLKVLAINKTEAKFIFPPCPLSFRFILSHFVILRKYVLPDLRYTFTASRTYTEWNATIRCINSEWHPYSK